MLVFVIGLSIIFDIMYDGHSRCVQGHDKFSSIVENLNPTEDGEAGEEPHGATNEAELGLQGHLNVPLYLVVGGRVEVDLNQLEGPVDQGGLWGELVSLEDDTHLPRPGLVGSNLICLT